MRHLAAVVSAMLLSCSATALADDGAPAASRFRFTLRPEVGYQGGTEQSELSATLTGLTVRSTLSYPVDTFIVGGRATAAYGQFELGASVHANVSQPGGTMLDQDFFNNVEISHTESRTEAKMLELEVLGRVRFRERPVAPGDPAFSLVFGYRHAKNQFDVYGLSGWQKPDGLTQVSVSLPDSILGIHYESTYEIPFVGARVDGAPSESVTLSLEGRILAAWSTHVDDHTFRHKIGTADMQSFGAELIAEASFMVARPLFVGGYFEGQFLEGSSGTLTQRFYADDPSTMAVESPSTQVPVANFSFKSDRVRLVAFVGLDF